MADSRTRNYSKTLCWRNAMTFAMYDDLESELIDFRDQARREGLPVRHQASQAYHRALQAVTHIRRLTLSVNEDTQMAVGSTSQLIHLLRWRIIAGCSGHQGRYLETYQRIRSMYSDCCIDLTGALEATKWQDPCSDVRLTCKDCATRAAMIVVLSDMIEAEVAVVSDLARKEGYGRAVELKGWWATYRHNLQVLLDSLPQIDYNTVLSGIGKPAEIVMLCIWAIVGNCTGRNTRYFLTHNALKTMYSTPLDLLSEEADAFEPLNL